jgi:hypothetical protein
MAYIGNTASTTNFVSGTDYFNGNASTVAFTLSRPVVTVNDIQVVVNNVVQDPSTAYTVSGSTLTFTGAPSSGTNNIYVRYLSTVMYNSITPTALSDQPNTSTGYFDLPAGTTAQRPSVPSTGMTRFNSDTLSLEFYNGTVWTATNLIPSINSVTGTIYAGISTTLTLSITNSTDICTIRFTKSGAVLKDITGVTITAGSGTVTVPSEVYGQTAGDTIVVSSINSDGTTSSNGVNKTVIGLPTGGTITTASSYRYHTFTSSANYVVPSGFTNTSDYLLVAGGGGGGGDAGGGGGAGGYISQTSVTPTAGTFSIVIGGGGVGGSSDGTTTMAANGSNTTGFGYTAIGGGKGGVGQSRAGGTGGSGGSGGGGGGSYPNPTAGYAGGAGTSGQGTNGNNGQPNPECGGAGGGAGGSFTTNTRNGGPGSTWLNGTTYAGGGGAGGWSSNSGNGTGYTNGYGGTGGGGNAGGAGTYTDAAGFPGTANTGGGGGGGSQLDGGAGGSGIVIIRYPI